MWSNDMSHTYTNFSVGSEVSEPLSFTQRQLLERAVAKVVLMGERVGVSPDQMILLLQSGLTVGELLDYLASRNREIV
jgi:hypothetical protein